MTVVVPWAILQASSRLAGEPQISFNSRPSLQEPWPPGHQRFSHLLTPLPIMAAAEPALPVRLMVAGRDTAIMGSATRWGLLVDRLCDCLEVGLGLLGRGGRGQGAVEGGGQGLGNGQGGQL